MIDVSTAVVTTIDRANRSLSAQFDDYSPGESSPHAYLVEPIPLCPAAFAPNDKGELVCLGTLARPEALFTDHYLSVGATYGDTNWVLDGGAGTVTQLTGVGAGVVRIAPNTQNALWLRKDREAIIVPEAPELLHMKCRVRSNLSGTAENPDALQVGFSAFTSFGQVLLTAFGGNLNEWRLSVVDTLGSTQAAVEATPFVVDQWYWCDIVCSQDFGAAAVDGNSFTGTTVDLAGLAVEPRLYIQDSSGGTNRLDVDVCAVNYVRVSDPVTTRVARSQEFDLL